MNPTAGRTVSTAVPVDGHTARVVDAGRAAVVHGRDGGVTRRADRVSVSERPPRYTVACDRRRRRYIQLFTQRQRQR